MTAINALATDGSSTNRAHLTPPQTYRTGTGTAWARFGVVYVNDLAPGEDGEFWESRNATNNAVNYGVGFDDSANDVQGLYNSNPGGSGDAISAATFYLVVETHSGTGHVVTVYVIACPSGTLQSTFTHTGSSSASDGQTQELVYGTKYHGVSTVHELRGRICPMGSLWGSGADQAQAAWQAFAVDPLNEGDALLATFGSNAFFFDDSNTDISTNALALTLTGTMAWGVGNGPDIPDRDAPVADGPSIEYVCNGDGDEAIIFDTVFEDEIFATINGASFGATQGAGGVFWNTADTLDGNEVEHTGTLEWSDALIRLVGNVDIGTHSPGALYVIVQNNAGLTGSLQIEVKATPAADAVGVRGLPAPQTVTLGGSFSFEASKIMFRSNCQQNLTYSATDLPTGLTCSPAGVISGTVSHLASDSYSSEAMGTDPLGATASDDFTYTVLNPGVPDPGGSTGALAPRVSRLQVTDSSRSIGIA